MKVTAPVGVPVAELTVAVNVTAAPTAAGFADDVRLVVVPAGMTNSETLSSASPLSACRA